MIAHELHDEALFPIGPVHSYSPAVFSIDAIDIHAGQLSRTTAHARVLPEVAWHNIVIDAILTYCTHQMDFLLKNEAIWLFKSSS